MIVPARLFVSFRFVVGGASALLAAPALAQAQEAEQGVSREVVQPLPPAETAELTEALRRIAADPQDVEALLMAGKASLRLEDPDAAMGFFTRARDLGTAGGRAKAGLAAALVYRKMPVEALKLFAEAEAEGASPLTFAADYGLALDLVGDNVRAQSYYQMALRDHADEEVTRRLALSQAIAGDQAASEMTLLPLLQRQDLAAYRTRAFALAALGKTEEAVAIAEAIMPASLAARIAPYLRYMPKLTRAQQAAAANFGHFPEASAIGKDDPRIAEYARAAGGTRLVSAPADGRLVPAGEPFGRIAQPSPPPPGPRITVAPAEPEPAGQDEAASAPAGPLPPDTEPQPQGDGAGAEFDLASLAGNRSGTISPDDVARGRIGEGRGVAAAAPAENGQASGAASGTAAPAAPEPESLAAAFADFDVPEGGVAPAPGAVDVTAIEPAHEAKPEPAKEVRKPAHPSRIWVQVATGRDRSALGFDWRRIVRQGGDAMRGRSGYLVRWGRTNRLVTGPFDSRQQALAFVSTLKQAGIDSFMFTSEEGEAVEALPRR